MADRPGTLETIARELGEALAPLQARLTDGDPGAFLDELGIRVPGGISQAANAIATTAVKAGALLPLIAELIDAIDDGDAVAIAEAAIPLVTGIGEVVDSFTGMQAPLEAAVNASAGITAAQKAYLNQQVAELPGRLLEWMLIEHVQRRSGAIYQALLLLGVITDILDPGDPTDIVKPPRRLRGLHLDRIISLATSPTDYLGDALDFGTPGFDGMRLFGPLRDYLDELEYGVDLLTPPGGPAILEAYIFRLSVDPTKAPPSLTGTLRVPATHDVALTFPLGGLWTLTITTTSRFEAGLGAEVTYPLEFRLQPPTGSVSAGVDLGLAARRPDGSAMVLLGQAGRSRLELRRFAGSVGLAGSAGVGQPLRLEPHARFVLEDGRLVLDFSGADGFIAEITEGFGIDATFGLAGVWAPSTGLQLDGSGGIEIALPTHVSLGPIEISTLYIRVSLGDSSAIPIELSGAFNAGLGPITAAVDRIGMIVTLDFPPDRGNLGPIDLGFAFKPPNGIGLAIDAGVVRGGGYLDIDPERGEYSGVLQLDLAGIVTVTAIGVITTRMPDGTSGFSLLLVITAEFGSGIQLGFGFTLLGVGGILGLNRAMNLPALVEGVRSNAIASVMFPTDVIANAPRIISDLKRFFPPQQGIFVIGPMAKLGWGTPTLVSLTLGVIIEIPGDIAIVGILRVALPADDVAVVVLQVNFIGAIEFDRSRVYFFAAIFDSRVLYLTIEGEMAVLAAFGDDANFVLSVGGFHPSFEPPPLPVPVPRRVALDLVNTPTALLRVEGYFAVTSNTAQFGARLDLRLGFDDFGVTGHLAFDALIQFSPFQFIVAVSASVSLRVFGFDTFSIRLKFALSGPTPWRAKGTGSISLLFWSFDVDFDETFGEERHTTLPDVQIMPLLAAEFRKLENWRTELPPGASTHVTLRQLDPVVDTLVLHPVGVLEVSQRLAPLNQGITRLGNSKASDATQFALTVGGTGLARQGDVLESFAPAQFNDFSDAEKLSRKAYEPGHGGLALSAAGSVLRTGPAIRRVVRYEVITVDTGWRRHVRRFRLVLEGLFTFFLLGAAVSKNAFSKYQAGTMNPFPDAVQAGHEGFAVASALDNTVVATFVNESQALDHLASRVAADASLTGTLHVVPAFEAVGA
jgi:hypothetical protein